MMRSLLGCCWLVLTALLLAGCGGGGSHNGGSSADSSMSMTVDWPVRSRNVSAPSSALSFSLTLSGAGATGQDVTLSGNRNSEASAHTETYTLTNLKSGTFAYQLRFYSEVSGTGTVVATASGNLAVAHSTTFPAVSLDAKIKSVVVAAGQSLRVGQSKTLLVEARDSDNAVVPVSPNSFVWSIPTGGTFLTQDQGTFTGMSSGTSTVVASVDGVQSDPVQVMVSNQTTVTYTVGSTLQWAAFKDGSGAWTVVNVPADGILHATVTSPDGKYGWAVVTTDPDSLDHYRYTIYYSTTDEVTTVYYPKSEAGTLQTQPFTVNVSGITHDEYTSVDTGAGEIANFGYGKTTNGFKSILGKSNTGSQMVIAYSREHGQSSPVNHMVLLRDIPSSQSSVDIDLSSLQSSSFQKVTLPVQATAWLFFQEGQSLSHWQVPELNNDHWIPPSSALRANDYFVTSASRVIRYSKVLDPSADYTPVEGWTASVNGGNGSPVIVHLPQKQGVTYYVYRNWATSAGNVAMWMTAGWHGSADADVQVPDLSNLAGWSPGYPTLEPAGFASIYVWNLPVSRVESDNDAGFLALAQDEALMKYFHVSFP